MTHALFEIKGPIQSGKSTVLAGALREVAHREKGRALLIVPDEQFAYWVRERRLFRHAVAVEGPRAARELMETRQFTAIGLDDFERIPRREELFEACKEHLDRFAGPSTLLVASTTAEFDRTARLVPTSIRPTIDDPNVTYR